jgi:hypothetical protein
MARGMSFAITSSRSFRDVIVDFGLSIHRQQDVGVRRAKAHRPCGALVERSWVGSLAGRAKV